MPRDGLQQYAPPPGTQGVANYTVESARYNTFVADITADQNNPRPIVAGGTGANNAHDAMVALGGEIANQGDVRNFDTFPFVSGSFFSTPGATSGPPSGDTTANYFAGIAYMNGTLLTLEARLITGSPSVIGAKYVRTKDNTGWSAWAQQAGSVADLDAAYVNVTGDTMTGALNMSHCGITLVGAAGANDTEIYGFKGAQPRWLMRMGDAGVESGGNVGSDFRIYSFGDTGALIGNAVSIQRNTMVMTAGGGIAIPPGGSLLDFSNGTTIYRAVADGSLTLTSQSNLVKSTGSFVAGASGATGTYYFGDSGTKSLSFDGTNIFTLNGGHLYVPGNNNAFITGGVFTGYASPTVGTYYFGNNGTKYISYDGTTFNLVGGVLAINSGACYFGAASSGMSLSYDGTNFLFTGARLASIGYLCKQGISGAWGPNAFDFYYNAGLVQCWIDNSNLGNITLTSDYRIKKDVLDLPSMWDVVKGLRPIKYTQADFTPPAQLEANEKRKAEGQAVAEGPMFRADNIERWGFIAHELQETLIPSASTGVKDSPDHVQSPNPFTVIAALTKALQETMARVEQLEARVAQPK
jgi:hypothetical protein